MLFNNWTQIDNSLYRVGEQKAKAKNQELTNEAFSNKWTAFSQETDFELEKTFNFQTEWFLRLYGFETEAQLSNIKKI